MLTQRELYQSSNGDRWSLCREDEGRVFVLHQANLASGGSSKNLEIAEFLAPAKPARNSRLSSS